MAVVDALVHKLFGYLRGQDRTACEHGVAVFDPAACLDGYRVDAKDGPLLASAQRPRVLELVDDGQRARAEAEWLGLG